MGWHFHRNSYQENNTYVIITVEVNVFSEAVFGSADNNFLVLIPRPFELLYLLARGRGLVEAKRSPPAVETVRTVARVAGPANRLILRDPGGDWPAQGTVVARVLVHASHSLHNLKLQNIHKMWSCCAPYVTLKYFPSIGVYRQLSNSYCIFPLKLCLITGLYSIEYYWL